MSLTKGHRHTLNCSSKSCLFLLGSWILLGFLYLVWVRVSILFFSMWITGYLSSFFQKSIFSPVICSAAVIYITSIHECVWALYSSLVIYLSICVPCHTILIAILYYKSCSVLGWDHYPLSSLCLYISIYILESACQVPKVTCQDFLLKLQSNIYILYSYKELTSLSY